MKGVFLSGDSTTLVVTGGVLSVYGADNFFPVNHLFTVVSGSDTSCLTTVSERVCRTSVVDGTWLMSSYSLVVGRLSLKVFYLLAGRGSI